MNLFKQLKNKTCKEIYNLLNEDYISNFQCWSKNNRDIETFKQFTIYSYEAQLIQLLNNKE